MAEQESEIQRLVREEVQRQLEPLITMITEIRQNVQQAVEGQGEQSPSISSTLPDPERLLRAMFSSNTVAQLTWHQNGKLIPETLRDRLAMMPRPELVAWWEAVNQRKCLEFLTHGQLVELVFEDMLVEGNDAIQRLRNAGLV